jgi:hypothetical protein
LKPPGGGIKIVLADLDPIGLGLKLNNKIRQEPFGPEGVSRLDHGRFTGAHIMKLGWEGREHPRVSSIVPVLNVEAAPCDTFGGFNTFLCASLNHLNLLRRERRHAADQRVS